MDACSGRAGKSIEENNMTLRRTLLCTALVLGAAIVPVAGDAKEIIVQIAPPALRVETVPAPRVGYVWAPGYWGWRSNKHVWVGGHYIRERHGYHWVPHRWEDRDGRWYQHNGYWER
jgi:hypothetical protein